MNAIGRKMQLDQWPQNPKTVVNSEHWSLLFLRIFFQILAFILKMEFPQVLVFNPNQKNLNLNQGFLSQL